MSIFEAEVRHRIGDEDILTSRVFGTLSIVDKHTVLAPFLASLGLSLTEKEIPSLSVSLWKAYGDVKKEFPEDPSGFSLSSFIIPGRYLGAPDGAGAGQKTRAGTRG